MIEYYAEKGKEQLWQIEQQMFIAYYQVYPPLLLVLIKAQTL